MLRSLIPLLLMLAILPGVVGAQTALTLSKAYELAREQNPMLHAAWAAAEAAEAQEGGRSLPPDPEIQLGVMNASLPDLRTDMPGAMLPSIEAMQMIPLPGKLRLGGEIARQSTAMVRSGAEEKWWEVRARTAMAFYDIYAADRQIEVMEETRAWLRQIEETATSMYAVGSGSQSDVLRAGVELARMEADIARMRAMRSTAVARLNAVLGRPAETPVPAVVHVGVPAQVPAFEEVRGWAEESRPVLERGRLAVERARSRERLARLELWPDLKVGLQYGQRPSEMGTERMGSVMLGFSVPIFAGQRQMKMREEAAAMEQMADAELADLRVGIDARIREILADLERATTLIALYGSDVLPQAGANVTSALSSYRVGRVDFMTLLDSQMTLNRYSQELYVLRAEYGELVAELEMAIGRELPFLTKTVEEEGT